MAIIHLLCVVLSDIGMIIMTSRINSQWLGRKGLIKYIYFLALIKQIGMLNVYIQWNGDGIAMASMLVFFIYALFDYWE